MMARPTKLTPEAHEQIVRALTAGATRTDAAMSAGVHYESFLNWFQRGAQSKSGQFFEFFKAVTNAEATVRIALANSLAVAGKTDWRAAEAYLKRRDRANWGDAQIIDARVETVEGYDYGSAIAALAPRPVGDSKSSRAGESGSDGAAVGEDHDGGESGDGDGA